MVRIFWSSVLDIFWWNVVPVHPLNVALVIKGSELAYDEAAVFDWSPENILKGPQIFF